MACEQRHASVLKGPLSLAWLSNYESGTGNWGGYSLVGSALGSFKTVDTGHNYGSAGLVRVCRIEDTNGTFSIQYMEKPRTPVKLTSKSWSQAVRSTLRLQVQP